MDYFDLGQFSLSPQYMPDASNYMGTWDVGGLNTALPDAPFPMASPSFDYGYMGTAPGQYEADYGAGPAGLQPYQGAPPTPMGGGGILDALRIDPSTLQALLLLGGLGAAGASFFGGGPESQYHPRLTPTQQGLLGQATGGLAGMEGVAGALQPQQLGLFNQGAGLLQGLMSGGQVPPALSNLVNASYDPYVADIASNAIESARRRGFYGGLGEGPAAAIASPALANLPGLKAQTTLNTLMPLSQQLLGQGQQAFQNRQNIASGYGSLFGGLQTGSHTQGSVPLSQQIQDALKILGAAGTAAGSVKGLSGAQ